MNDDIIKPVDVMSENELISILTVNKENFNDEFRRKALDELSNRGIKLDDILNVASYKINTKEFEKVDVNSAYEKIAMLDNPFDVIYFRNYMAEFVAIQKTADFFVFHFYNKDSGFSSIFISDEDELKNSLKEFLTYGNWRPEGTDIIEHWDTLAESSSKEYIYRLVKMLDETDLYYCINSINLARFNSFNSPYSIILAAEDIEAAEEVLDKMEDLGDELHQKLELAEKNNDLDKQLEILEELESVTPEDSVLYYNKAQLLDQKGDYEAAAEAVIYSFNLDYENGEVDDVEDIESYLLEIVNKVKSKSNILHCLATIALYKQDNDTALSYYSQLIELDKNDKIAHLNLGHLYYSHFEDDEKVKLHFNKYIELETNREETESIKAILDNLGN